jgi:heme/copper-type cytochrome/quinol oxidase subunit 3
MSNAPQASATTPDPIRERRQRIAHWTLLANRVGYLFIGTAIALFFIALAVGFSSGMATAVTTTLIIGCVLLAPSIVVGYAVKAAERDDRERGL